MGRKKLIENFESFIHNISPKDRLAILYHADADGLCSAVVVEKALEKILNFKPKLIFRKNQGDVSITRVIINELVRKGVNKLIILDLCVDQHPKRAREVAKFCSILILDHHKLYNDLNSKNILQIKSRHISSYDGSLYPTSKLSFDLFSRLANIDDIGWVASVGIIGDNNLMQWKDFVEDSLPLSKLSLTNLIEIKEMVSAVESINISRMNGLFDEFVKVKKPKALLKSKFMKEKKRLEKELDRLFKRVQEDAEFYPDIELVYYLVKSKHSIKSALINKISNELFPNQTVVLVLDSGGKILSFSARRQDFKVRMNDLLEEAVKGLKGASAGGHTPAAAGKLRRRDLKKFKSRIIRILKKK